MDVLRQLKTQIRARGMLGFRTRRVLRRAKRHDLSHTCGPHRIPRPYISPHHNLALVTAYHYDKKEIMIKITIISPNNENKYTRKIS